VTKMLVKVNQIYMPTFGFNENNMVNNYGVIIIDSIVIESHC
jgi:hypothetical protein